MAAKGRYLGPCRVSLKQKSILTFALGGLEAKFSRFGLLDLFSDAQIAPAKEALPTSDVSKRQARPTPQSKGTF